MRERAESLGGTLKIVSSPGQGTRITVEVGLANEDGEDG
jgi:signal transduction histidine kinase